MSVGAVNKNTGDRIPTAGMPAIDDALDLTSVNPVQNAIITAALADKQNKTDNNLQTTDKTVVGAVNELKSGLINYENQNNLNLEVTNRKNLLPMKVSTIKSINTSGTWSGNTYTINGMTFRITGDAEDNLTSVTLNGKATANCYFMLNNVVVFDVDSFNSYTPSNKYKAITGTGSGGDVNSYSVVYQASNHETYIRVAVNYTSDNITLAPMITELWVTDSTFAPYIPSVDARLDAVEERKIKWFAIEVPANATEYDYSSDAPEGAEIICVLPTGGSGLTVVQCHLGQKKIYFASAPSGKAYARVFYY